jgi:formate dehydrogenase iron-sulfur subunit
MPLQSLDVVRRSATTLPSPEVRGAHTGQVAKLIDTTKCIGCKACQVACMEWNDLRDEIGTCTGHYENPADLSEHSWTLMRYAEYENPKGDLEWLIRKDGCMHCEDPGCLKACPSPGAIVQYANGIVDFQEENCIGCGYCIAGCPFDIPRISKKDKKAYKCTLCSDRVAVGLEPACVKACPTGAIVFGTKEDMTEHAQERIVDLKSRGFDQAGLYDPAGVGRHARDVRPAPRGSAAAVQRVARKAENQSDGGPVEGRYQAAGAVRDGRDRGHWFPALHRHRAERDRRAGRGSRAP